MSGTATPVASPKRSTRSSTSAATLNNITVEAMCRQVDAHTTRGQVHLPPILEHLVAAEAAEEHNQHAGGGSGNDVALDGADGSTARPGVDNLGVGVNPGGNVDGVPGVAPIAAVNEGEVVVAGNGNGGNGGVNLNNAPVHDPPIDANNANNAAAGGGGDVDEIEDVNRVVFARMAGIRNCHLSAFDPFPLEGTGTRKTMFHCILQSPTDDALVAGLKKVMWLFLEDWDTARSDLSRRCDDTTMMAIAFSRTTAGGMEGPLPNDNSMTGTNYTFFDAVINLYAFALAINSTKYMAKEPARFYTNFTHDQMQAAIATNQAGLIEFFNTYEERDNLRFIRRRNVHLKQHAWQIIQLGRDWCNKLRKGIITSWNGARDVKGALWVHHFFLLQNVLDRFCMKDESDLSRLRFIDNNVTWRDFFDVVPRGQRRGSILIWKGTEAPANYAQTILDGTTDN